MSNLETINESLELAAEHIDDLVPLVYERFFARRPETERLFKSDPLLRGRMLNETLTLILESAQGTGYVDGIIEREVVDHRAYGVTVSMYESYFESVIDVLKSALNEAWTPAHEKAWRDQFERLMKVVDRHATESHMER